MGGIYAPLFKGGGLIDTVEVYFGVRHVAGDTVLVLPVDVQAPDPLDGPVGYPTDFTLTDGRWRTSLSEAAPFVSDYSSPAVIGGAIWYWGLAPSEREHEYRLLAIRYAVRSGATDSTYLTTQPLHTGNTSHLIRPAMDAHHVAFVLGEHRWHIDAATADLLEQP